MRISEGQAGSIESVASPRNQFARVCVFRPPHNRHRQNYRLLAAYERLLSIDYFQTNSSVGSNIGNIDSRLVQCLPCH